MIAKFMFSIGIHVLSWSNGVSGVNAIQPLISDEFCHLAQVCPADQCVLLIFQLFKETNQLDLPIRVTANRIDGFLTVLKLL
jgi:hypothetical protein